jgi:hypothetical protein
MSPIEPDFVSEETTADAKTNGGKAGHGEL